MKKIILLIIFLNLQLISCQKKNSKNDLKKESIEKLTTEVFFKEFTTIYGGDNGLLQTGNADLKKGNFEIYLISKKGAKLWTDELNQKGNYQTEIKKLNLLSPKKIAENFDIWIFYTDKKYLLELEDKSLGIKVPGVIELYKLKSGKDEWEKIDSYNIEKEGNRVKLFDWKQKKIEEILDNSNKRNKLNKKASLQIADKWIGKYSAYFSYGKIGEQDAGWALDIEITKEKIIAIGEGYQIGFKDLLTATEKNNDELLLNYDQNLSGYPLGSKMNPEFIIIKSNNKYFVQSEWIDSDIITEPDVKGYLIHKD